MVSAVVNTILGPNVVSVYFNMVTIDLNMVSVNLNMISVGLYMVSEDLNIVTREHNMVSVDLTVDFSRRNSISDKNGLRGTA
jgi:hypothetical protein